MGDAMTTATTIDTFATEQARTYFAEWLADPTGDFLNDTFEVDDDDADELTDALFAAEIVAAQIGQPAAGLPEAVKESVKGKPVPNKKLLARARTAVRKAQSTECVLHAKWQAEGTEAAWLAAVNNLIGRLT